MSYRSVTRSGSSASEKSRGTPASSRSRRDQPVAWHGHVAGGPPDSPDGQKTEAFVAQPEVTIAITAAASSVLIIPPPSIEAHDLDPVRAFASRISPDEAQRAARRVDAVRRQHIRLLA